MKIFLTGASGFIGRHILSSLLQNGYSVVALSTNYQPLSLPSLTFLPKRLVDLLPHDLEDIDLLIHAAAHSVSYPFDTLTNCLNVNLFDSLHLLRCAEAVGLRNVISLGSCYEYGSHSAPLSCSTTLLPSDSYSLSKALFYQALSQWTELNQSTTHYLRLFHVYGPGEHSSRFWPSLRKSSLSGDDFYMTSGDQIREFTYVKSVSTLICDLVIPTFVSEPQFKTTNVASTRPLTLRDFALSWWTHWKSKGVLHFDSLPQRPNEIMSCIAADPSYQLQPPISELL